MAETDARSVRVTNSLTNKKEPLETIRPGRVTMYSCGPTVYNYIHIGNLRSAIVADLIFRYLKKAGYQVTYVRNYTDIDDRIIQKAIDEKTEFKKVTERFIAAVESDYAGAGLEEPTHKTRATDHIPEILKLIENIIKRDHGYVAEGEVFFSVESFSTYGKLSHKNLEDLRAGVRIEVDPKKRNHMDFSLWKPVKPGEPSWDSPWGKGRPGWHIECSAMASKWLGEQIDIHHGGQDLIFPHHENEIAQSEAGSGRAPFVKYWLHNAFLTLRKEKMSKSLGNVFLAKDFLASYSGEVARMLTLSVHYRSLIDFGDETIQQTLDQLTRLYEAKRKAIQLQNRKSLMPDTRAENLWGEFVSKCSRATDEFYQQMDNDFNTPGALAALFSLVREFNRVAKEQNASSTPGAVLASTQLLEFLENDLFPIFGVGAGKPAEVLADLNRMRAESKAVGGQLTKDDIEKLIVERQTARGNKNFDRADEIRVELDKNGVILKDSPQGTTWQYK